MKVFLIILFVFFNSGLGAMEWPVGEDAVLVQNFGFNNKGRPVLGTVFEGEGGIKAVEGGEIVFSITGKEKANRVPSPLGNWSAVDHGNGLLSIYSRYEEGSLTEQSSVAKGSEIASLGTSGFSGSSGLYFILYDYRERRWVNPSLIITHFEDSVPPQISGIQLFNASGRLMETSGLRNLSQGMYKIRVNIFDTLSETRRTQLAPYRIICSVNGEEAGTLTLDTISAVDGTLMVNRNGLWPVKNIYEAFPGFEAAEVQLIRGLVMLEIIAMDISGNSRSTLTRLNVE